MILNPPAGSSKVSAGALSAYKDLISDCQALDAAQKALAALGPAAHFGAMSPLGEALAESAPPAKNPATAGPDDATLQAQIKAAAALAKGGDAKALATFQTQVEDLLKTATTAAKIAGLKTLQAGVSDQLNGALCAPPPATGTDCKAIAATSASGRAASVWTALQALAQTLDANDPRYRSANWLAGANAILAAEKQDAQIQANAEAQAAAMAHTRLLRLAAAASHLAETHSFVATKTLPCSGADPAYCGLAATLAAWNEGLIPADVLAYRETQVFSQTVVQRQKAAQTEQQALARSASASLKAYADGGIPPSVIAQLLVDTGLIAAAAK